MRQCLLQRTWRSYRTDTVCWTSVSLASLSKPVTTSIANQRNQHGIATKPPKAAKRPATPLPATSSQAAYGRQLLRGLLRECTYLPDSFARQWTHKHVLDRFRRYGIKVWKHRNDPDFEERIKSKHREARQAISQLRRANEGERKPLLKVLLMAYGRTGKRRHELILPLSGPEEQLDSPGAVERPRNARGGENLQQPDSLGATAPPRKSPPTVKDVNNGNWSPYAPELTPQLRALLQSQVKDPPPHLIRPVVRRLNPRIEELNSWKRPMPRSRIKNQTKQWYAELLHKVHPPVPTAEWYRLRDLALGVKTESLVTKRRSSKGTQPSALDLVVMYGQPAAGISGENRSAHAITPRFMRRLYTQVFSQCPLMDWDVEKQTWSVTWGEQAQYRMGAGTTRPHSPEDLGIGIFLGGATIARDKREGRIPGS